MGEDKDSKSKDSQTNDLALGDESAAGVKGGREVTEPLAVHKAKRTSHKGHAGPARGMPHE